MTGLDGYEGTEAAVPDGRPGAEAESDVPDGIVLADGKFPVQMQDQVFRCEQRLVGPVGIPI